MRYILDRNIGEPVYIILESPEGKSVVTINSADELFDFLLILKEVRNDGEDKE